MMATMRSNRARIRHVFIAFCVVGLLSWGLLGSSDVAAAQGQGANPSGWAGYLFPHPVGTSCTLSGTDIDGSNITDTETLSKVSTGSRNLQYVVYDAKRRNGELDGSQSGSTVYRVSQTDELSISGSLNPSTSLPPSSVLHFLPVSVLHSAGRLEWNIKEGIPGIDEKQDAIPGQTPQVIGYYEEKGLIPHPISTPGGTFTQVVGLSLRLSRVKITGLKQSARSIANEIAKDLAVTPQGGASILWYAKGVGLIYMGGGVGELISSMARPELFTGCTTGAPTTSSGPSYSDFVGTWEAHDTTGLTIAGSGVGSVGFPDFGACPSCSELGAPTDTISFALHKVENGDATGTITASSDSNGIGSDGSVVPGMYAVGTPVEVKITPGSPGRLLHLSVNGFNQTFCDSSASSNHQCGA